MRHWLPLWAKSTATCVLPHPETEHRQGVNNFSSCIFGNEGIVGMFEHITGLLAAFVGENTMQQRTNTDSKIIDIAYCKPCKNKLSAGELVILIRYY